LIGKVHTGTAEVNAPDSICVTSPKRWAVRQSFRARGFFGFPQIELQFCRIDVERPALLDEFAAPGLGWCRDRDGGLRREMRPPLRFREPKVFAIWFAPGELSA
jgi:hypothetical protein